MFSPRSMLTIRIHQRQSAEERNGTEIIWTYGDFTFPQRLLCDTEKLRFLRHNLAQAYNGIHGPGTRRCAENARENLRHVLKKAHRIGRELTAARAMPDNVLAILRLIKGRPVDWQIEAAPASMFALDMLPLGWLGVKEKDFEQHLKTRQSTAELASMLPCWQWPVVRRFLEMNQSAKGALRHGNRVRMAFVGDGAHHQVEGSRRRSVRKSRRMLVEDSRIQSGYCIEKVWPDDSPKDTKVIIEKLSRHLTDPEYMPRGCHYPGEPAAVTHFFCHGRTSADGRSGPQQGMDFEMHIGQGRKRDGHHKISIRTLQAQMDLHEAEQVKQGRTNRQRTMIFMNACGGATQSRKDDVALASVLFGKRHPAVIAAESIVDTGTAKRLSVRFYDHLLEGVPAHVALWHAQRDLVCDISTNKVPYPAVLLYSCYGIPSCALGGFNAISKSSAPFGAAKIEFDSFFPSSSPETNS